MHEVMLKSTRSDDLLEIWLNDQTSDFLLDLILGQVEKISAPHRKDKLVFISTEFCL